MADASGKRISISEERVKNIIHVALHEELKDYPTRRELILTVALAVLSGSTLGTVVSSLITGNEPARQARIAARFVAALFT